MNGGRAIALASVLVLSAALAPVGVGAADAGATDDTIERTVTLSLTPADPGSLSVQLSYDVPDRVTSLDVQLPETATVTDASGFEHASGRTYNWTGESTSPRLEFDYAANVSAAGGRSPGRASHGGDGFSFVDAGPWALVRLPRAPSSWGWTGETPVGITTTHRTETAGFVGSSMAYLGPHVVHTRTAAGQRFSVVVPEAASMDASVDDVLSSLAAASRSLRVGDRDPSVNVFVAPTTLEWAAGGLQLGDTDAWVLDDAALSDVRNVWLHEYVHTRQTFETEPEVRWFDEASAEYYAALLSLRQDLVDYEAFRETLSYGTNPVYDQSVLSRPSSWVAGTQYFVGALVTAAVDRRLRLATNGSATLQAVFADMNARDDAVSGPEFEALVRRHGGDAVAAAAVRWATTTERPSTWSASEHAAAFGTTPPTFDARLEGATYRVAGPYRNVSGDAVPAVVTGETLTIDVPVENTGDLAGSGTVTLVQDDTVVDAAEVDLAAGESTSVSLEAAFDGPGTYTLLVGTERVTVTVREPAAPTVESLALDRTSVAPGEAVSVSATVSAPADLPAAGTVAVRVNGTARNETAVALGPGETTTVTATVTLEEPGEHTVAVGERTATVTVRESETGVGAGTPGFGAPAALVAVALAAALAGWRRA